MKPNTIHNLATLDLRGLRILAAILAMLNCRPKGALLLCSGVVALEAMGDIILSWIDSFSITSSASTWYQGFQIVILIDSHFLRTV